MDKFRPFDALSKSTPTEAAVARPRVTPTRNAIGLSSPVGVQSTDGVGELSPWRSSSPSYTSKALPSTQGEESLCGAHGETRERPTDRLPLEGGGKTRHELAPPTCANRVPHTSPGGANSYLARQGGGVCRKAATPPGMRSDLAGRWVCDATVADSRLSPWRSVLPLRGGGVMHGLVQKVKDFAGRYQWLWPAAFCRSLRGTMRPCRGRSWSTARPCLVMFSSRLTLKGLGGLIGATLGAGGV